jgi:hypothetical protein
MSIILSSISSFLVYVIRLTLTCLCFYVKLWNHDVIRLTLTCLCFLSATSIIRHLVYLQDFQTSVLEIYIGSFSEKQGWRSRQKGPKVIVPWTPIPSIASCNFSGMFFFWTSYLNLIACAHSLLEHTDVAVLLDINEAIYDICCCSLDIERPSTPSAPSSSWRLVPNWLQVRHQLPAAQRGLCSCLDVCC